MPSNLVIVESPAKAKTIEKFLGKDYKVMSSYGHIRDLKKHKFSVDTDTFEPVYEVPADKQNIVSQLKTNAKKADVVWLASDEDREGEAIAWHLQQVLGLDPEATKRIVFHEITKPAILEAIEKPRKIDLGLVNAQQARRVLDRIVGFKLSPVLWRKVKPNLSAGRVQSVAVRLIVEREREVQAFEPEAYYRVTAQMVKADGTTFRADLNRRFQSEDEARDFLESIKEATFTIEDIQKRPIHRSPAPPFTTSTLQQEAAHKLGLPVSQTMLIAQRLYESGLITYMRTDSLNLSRLALAASKTVITEQMGEQYVKIRSYHTSSKGAQEAHEAIRPTYLDRTDISQGRAARNQQERRLYELIWKRTIASQMADAELEKTNVTISIDGHQEKFVATGEVVTFDGFLKVYRDTEVADTAETTDATEGTALLPALALGESLTDNEVQAIERFTQRPQRYNEASLVRKLEELGIGRPSTYAPTISTIQQREYVAKNDKPGEQRSYHTLTLADGKIKTATHKVTLGAERGRLVPTDTGIVVNDFLMQYFPTIMDYNFTADVEKEFDAIADGQEEWQGMIHNFYETLDPLVEKTLNSKNELRAGERLLGNDPATGLPVSVKIGRFGPVAQLGEASDTAKPRFAQLNKGQSIETITLDEALELFRLPRILGQFEGDDVNVGRGRYGFYVLNQKKFVSIPDSLDPFTLTLDEAIELIKAKRQDETDRHIKAFDEEPDLEIVNGRYGPYIVYKGNNYHLTKPLQKRAAELSLEECMDIIKEQNEHPKTTATTRRRFAKRK
ncbi:MAG: type I DNA topoisomerase [Bacteroidaceae bacterium]|nr:type I DNA topoisomerase [Bacteroidaceae bacterium]